MPVRLRLVSREAGVVVCPAIGDRKGRWRRAAWTRATGGASLGGALGQRPREGRRGKAGGYAASHSFIWRKARAIDPRYAEIKVLGTDIGDGTEPVTQWVCKPTGIASSCGLRLYSVQSYPEIALHQPSLHLVSDIYL